jgi:cytochrome P450
MNATASSPLRAAARAGAAVTGVAPIPTLAGLPLLGSALEFRRDRLGLLDRVARLGPVARFHLGPVPVHLVTDPELAHGILVDQADSFVKSPGLSVFARPLLGEGLLTSEAALHRRQRKLLAPAFAPRRMATYAAAMADEAARTARAWRDGAVVDLADEMMEMTLAIAGRTLFGADVRGDARVVGDALAAAMKAMLDGLSSPVQVPASWPIPRNLRMRRAVAALDRVVGRLVAERRASGDDRGDVLSMLLLARDDQDGTGMSDRQVRDEVMTLILAGHETTANALSWTLHALGRHPRLRARVEAEIDALDRPPDDLARLPFTQMVLDEAMRLWPPAYIMGRQVSREVVVAGVRFPAGATLLINVRGIHRRADLYPEPHAFRPDRMTPEQKKVRPRGAYLPFGAGPRVCIGSHFALLEAATALAVLLRWTRLEPLAAGEPAAAPLVTLRPRGGLPMRVRARTAD